MTVARREMKRYREGWGTIAEAAACLGMSEKTIRRRIKAGLMPAELVDGPRGPQYLVALPAGGSHQDMTVPERAGPAADAVANAREFSAVVEQYHDSLRFDLTQMQEELARTRRQLAEMSGILAALQNRLGIPVPAPQEVPAHRVSPSRTRRASRRRRAG